MLASVVQYRILMVIGVVMMFLASAVAQDTIRYDKINTIDQSIQSFTTDAFKNIYLVNDQDEILKYNEVGELLFRYGVRANGPIHSIDVTNPFKPVVHYKETNLLVVLDRSLSEISRTDLLDLNILSVSALCSSTNDEVWLFDQVNQQLLRVNHQLDISVQGERLKETVKDELEPTFMMEHQNAVYVSDSLLGVYVFDAFGNHYKTIPIKGIASFQIINDQLLYFRSDQLNIWNLTYLSESFQPIPQDVQAKDVRIHHGRLYLLDSKQLHLYSF